MVRVSAQVERLSRQVLFEIMGRLALFRFVLAGVKQIAIARVECFRQKEEAAKTVAVFVKVSLVSELVLVIFPLVGPDVFNFKLFLSRSATEETPCRGGRSRRHSRVSCALG